MQAQLGTLKKIDLRAAWEGEASHFTPWLALEPNLKLLGDTIGLELELEATERSVGPFRADILCKEVGSDRWILVENQLEPTDHTHMGQLITYAAGLDAVTIVWIARQFREEHRAALDWLNSVTGTEIHFFGWEVELWQIGDSALAPKFNVVCQPNDWIKFAKEEKERVEPANLTQAKQLQLRLWTAFHAYLQGNSKLLNPRKPHPQHWSSFSIGRNDFELCAIASMWSNHTNSYQQNEIRAEMQMHGVRAKEFYEQLEAQKEAIEGEVGQELEWYNPDSARMCRIYLRRDADLEDETQWPHYFAWLQENLENLHRVFRPRIQNLTVE